MRLKNFFVKAFILVVISLCTAVCAQADRVASILYLNAPAGAPESAFAYQAEGQKAQEITLRRNNFSKPFDLPAGDLSLSFLPALLTDGAPLPANAPQLKLPAHWKKVLILVFEDENNPVMPIRLRAIDASENVFSPGELLFVNFSEISIFGMVGPEKVLSKPQTMTVVSSPISKKGSYHVKLDSVEDDIESRRWFVRQTWQHIPSVRFVVFVLPLDPPRLVKLYVAPVRAL